MTPPQFSFDGHVLAIVGSAKKGGETDILPSRPSGRRSQLYAANGLWVPIISRE
jgi:hypothetical protein